MNSEEPERISDAKWNYWWGMCGDDEVANSLWKCVSNVYLIEILCHVGQHCCHRSEGERRSYRQRKNHKS